MAFGAIRMRGHRILAIARMRTVANLPAKEDFPDG